MWVLINSIGKKKNLWLNKKYGFKTHLYQNLINVLTMVLKTIIVKESKKWPIFTCCFVDFFGFYQTGIGLVQVEPAILV